MRLDKFISNNTSASRSEVRRLIKKSAVAVNGIPVANAAAQVDSSDRVTLNDTDVTPVGNLYYMLNKPAGFVCVNRDGAHPTVLDLLEQDASWTVRIDVQQLQIAGRLDLDTTGLVLITNDGAWNHRVTSPAKACEKVYRVTLAQPFDPDTLPAFAKGIQLDGEPRATRPARLEMLSPTTLLLTIGEGKYHQVKRMFAATGNHVAHLHRESIGSISLDTALAEGQFRPLTPEEVDSVNKTQGAP